MSYWRNDDPVARVNRLAAFDKAFNLDGWLAPWASFVDADRRDALGASQIATLVENGVRCVRIMAAPSVLTATVSENTAIYDAGGASWVPTATNLTLLADTINLLHAAGIRTIIEWAHITGENWTWSRVVQGQEPRWKSMWLAIAAWVVDQGFSSSMLAFEISNEIGYIRTPAGGDWNNPGTFTSQAALSGPATWTLWKAVQEDLISAMRAYVPRHWIFASDPFYQSMENCLLYDSVGDGLTAKAWHYYGPYEWSHQGYSFAENATFDGISLLTRDNGTALGYPVTAASSLAARNALASAGKTGLRDRIIAIYTAATGSTHGQDDMARHYQQANIWRRLHNQEGIITEIGRSKHAEIEDWTKWISDNRVQQARYGISTCWFGLWDVDFDGDCDTRDFGFFWRDPSTDALTPDTNSLAAAGFIDAGYLEHSVDALVDVSAPSHPGFGSTSHQIETGGAGL